jgi:hypothetical protein
MRIGEGLIPWYLTHDLLTVSQAISMSLSARISQVFTPKKDRVNWHLFTF